MAVRIENVGEVDGRKVRRATIDTGRGLTAGILEFGATLQHLRLDHPSGPVDLVLGYPELADYRRNRGYLGATVGRVGNRIGGGRFTLDGRTYELARNERDRTHLHGGDVGFSHHVWRLGPLEAEDEVVLDYRSPAGEEGYPGALEARCRYAIDADDVFAIDMTATADAATPVNLVNHTYWNLAGGGTIDDHELEVAGAAVLAVDENQVPTGDLTDIAGTPLDLRRRRRLDAAGPPEIDHCYVLEGEGFRHVAELLHPSSGRGFDLWTNQPAVQVYTAWKLDAQGSDGRRFGARSGLCLETEAYVDAVNQPRFPSAILQPGETYHHRMEFRFRR